MRPDNVPESATVVNSWLEHQPGAREYVIRSYNGDQSFARGVVLAEATRADYVEINRNINVDEQRHPMEGPYYYWVMVD